MQEENESAKLKFCLVTEEFRKSGKKILRNNAIGSRLDFEIASYFDFVPYEFAVQSELISDT